MMGMIPFEELCAALEDHLCSVAAAAEPSETADEKAAQIDSSDEAAELDLDDLVEESSN